MLGIEASGRTHRANDEEANVAGGWRGGGHAWAVYREAYVCGRCTERQMLLGSRQGERRAWAVCSKVDASGLGEGADAPGLKVGRRMRPSGVQGGRRAQDQGKEADASAQGGRRAWV